MKRIVSFLVAISMLTSVAVAATTQQQLDDAKNNLSGVQSQIDKNEKEQKSVLAEMDSLDTNINATERQIDGIEKEIEQLKESVKITEENIAYSQEQYDTKYELRKNRMVAYYKNGNVSLQDLISDTQDPTEKLYMERVIEKIVSYDTSLMEELEAEKHELERQKNQLEEDSTRCAQLQDELEVKLAGLEETKEIRTQYMATLEADHAALEETEDRLIAEADRLKKELEEQARNSTGTYSGKMVWPLPGHYVVTSPFGNRYHPVLHVWKLHTGVDLAGSNCNGDPVVAAADGTVIKATWSNAYGNYIIIDHGSGITTLYAHSSKLEVKVGDKVKAGQEIMKVGTTGYSTGPHLHFEVRENGTYVDPIGKGYIKH